MEHWGIKNNLCSNGRTLPWFKSIFFSRSKINILKHVLFQKKFNFFSGKMSSIFDEINFQEMSFDEKIGYLYGLLLLHKTGLIEVLNDQNKPDSNKFLYAIVLADGLTNVFNCILNLYQMREYFR